MGCAMEAVVSDVSLMARMIKRLGSRDVRSAALVCHVWNDAVRWAARRISVRYRESLPQLLARFRHLEELDLAFCLDDLQDTDLEYAGGIIRNHLKTLTLGCCMQPQVLITTRGLTSICGRNLVNLSLAYVPNIQDDAIQILNQWCKSMRSLSLETCPELTDAALEYFPAWKNLQDVVLKGVFDFTSAGLTNLGSCKELLKAKLDLANTDIDPALNSIAANCTKIEELNLKFKDATLSGLANCTSLKIISVHTDQRHMLDEAILNIAAANLNLMEVTFLSTYFPLNESTVVSIIMRHSSHLRKLHLEAPFMTDFTLMACKKLEYLFMDGSWSSGSGLAGLYHIKNLTLRSAKDLRDVDLQTLLDGKKQLQHLSFHNCTRLTSIGFSTISYCKNLQHLDLGFTSVDDLGLSHIAAGVKNLKSLSLVKCEHINSTSSIALFSGLECLNLEQCPFVTDEGLNVLANGCLWLRSLSLAFTRVTDAGLMWLTKCRELRYLSVPYCLSIQGDGILAVVSSCEWFQHAVISHRFKNSDMVGILRCRCFVRLEVDDMALIPFIA